MKSYFLTSCCRFCEGTGEVIVDNDKLETCSYCVGRGYCPNCSELGYTYTSCSVCSFVKGKNHAEIFIL